ncbi:putative Ig domain-containing protein, partial [Thiocapsa marina]|uniref:putative Ig domain-containing protein n=1 Tax=Thiocapsa marina TaxID=244573 RepID=UPI00059524E6
MTGIDQPAAIGPFVNGAFPSTTPTAGNDWHVEDAFPHIAVTNTTVIAPNPNDNRLYVGSRDGVIESFNNVPEAVTKDPFMDLRDRVAVVWDGGFLGMVFHPDFGKPGHPFERTFYTFYSSHCPYDATQAGVDLSNCFNNYPRDNTGPNSGFFGVYLRLARYEVYDAQTDILIGDPLSEEVLLNIRLTNNTHRGGGMTFGNDGRLYLTIGEQRRQDTAQDIENNLQGGVMRLAVDIDDNGDGTWDCPVGSHIAPRFLQSVTGNDDEVSGRLYCVPDDNPWVGRANSFEEYFSIGHRAPHRLALDPANGRLWLGEVGHQTREEINVLCSGCNFGWPFREGLTEGPGDTPATILGILTDPVIDFVRTEARAIIGGYVYRGSRFPELRGRYIAGDYVTDTIWAVDLPPGSTTATKEVLTTFTPKQLATFGEDNDGEIYLGDVLGTGPLQRLARSGAPVAEPPFRLSETGVFENLPNSQNIGGPADLQPAPGVIPYDLNSPLWSDAAFKYRFLVVPNDGTHDTPGERIAFSEEGQWGFPIGSVVVKHFELPSDPVNPDPSTARPTETRFLVHGEDGDWYGITYSWLPDGSDAILVGSTGATEIIDVGGADGWTYEWDYPSRTQCILCHTHLEFVLGPKTRQLNRSVTYSQTGRTANQLVTLNHLGLLSPSLEEAEINLSTVLTSAALDDETATLEHRARSYLDSNCAGCHRGPDGAAGRAIWDGRLLSSLDLNDTGMIGGNLSDDLGDPNLRVITPGSHLTSAAWLRLESIDPTLMMPPLAKHLADAQATEVFRDWIDGMPNQPPNLSHPGDRSNDEGDQVSLQLLATDPENDPLTWTFDQLPPGLTMDDYGLIIGTVGLGARGIYNVTVTVEDPLGGRDSETFAWTIGEPGNLPPTVSTPEAQTSKAGATVSVQIEAFDPDADPLTYSAAGLPPGLNIEPTTGLINGTIRTDAIGDYSVLVVVSDGIDTADAGFVWSVTATGGGVVLDYPDFADVAGWQLNGAALATEGVLRLTPAAKLLAGSAFHATALDIDADTSFSARLDFRVHGALDGADGLTFVVQGTAPTALGSLGTGLGYAGIPASLAVEIDTFKSRNTADPDANHLAVLLDGSVAVQQAEFSPAFDLQDGLLHTLWVDYDAPSGILAVYLAETPGTKPSAPVMSAALDLLGVVGPQAYVGFTAGTGGKVNNHDVEGFYFATAAAAPTNRAPLLSDPGDRSDATGTSVSLQVQASDPDGDALTFDAFGLPAGLTISSEGLIAGIITADAGDYPVTVSVSDGLETVTAGFVWSVTATGGGVVLDYPDFADVAGWQLNGAALATEGVLRLTPAAKLLA